MFSISRRFPIAVVFALAACSSSSSSTDGGVTAAQACADSAAAGCNLVQTCSGGAAITRDYGTLSACVTAETTTCIYNLGAPGTSRTPEGLEACVQAEQSEACTDYLSGNLPSACVPAAGGIANGQSCFASAQCASTFCAIPTIGSTCGVCQALPQAGDSCAVIGCGRNLVCSANTQTCLTYVADGGACTDEGSCLPGFDCLGLDAGGAAGLCQPEATASGAACDARHLTAPACDGHLGLVCESAVCVNETIADATTACGEFDGGVRACADGGATCIVDEDVVCGAGADCVEQNGIASCVAAAAPGAPCDINAGPTCFAPGKCVIDAGTSGVCVVASVNVVCP